jgi:hypothetical protein
MDNAGFSGYYELPEALRAWKHLHDDIVPKLPGFLIPKEILRALERADQSIQIYSESGTPDCLDDAAVYYKAAVKELEGRASIFFFDLRDRLAKQFAALPIHSDPLELEARKIAREGLAELRRILLPSKIDLEEAIASVGRIEPALEVLRTSRCSCRLGTDPHRRTSMPHFHLSPCASAFII